MDECQSSGGHRARYCAVVGNDEGARIRDGCVARFGDDWTEIHTRVGPVSLKHAAGNGWSTVETAGRCVREAKRVAVWWTLINPDYAWCLVYTFEHIACIASPVGVMGTLAFTSVATSKDVFDFGGSTCGLTASGAAYCWGENDFGQLGNGTTGYTNVVPGPVSGGLAFTAIDLGKAHACGLVTTGLVYCWGDNEFGQLGTGDRVTQTTPTAVAGGLTFTAIGTGSEHTCGVTLDAADAMIAVTAIRLDAVLVTLNARHFPMRELRLLIADEEGRLSWPPTNGGA